MKELLGPAGGGTPLWIRCTMTADGTPLMVNMAFASTLAPNGAGSRIFIADEKRAVDVVESPGEIVEAMEAAEHAQIERSHTEPTAAGPRPFAFPLARPEPRGR